MSDTMLYGVLRMPYAMAMENDQSRRQFYNRVQEALNRMQAAESTLLAMQVEASKPGSADEDAAVIARLSTLLANIAITVLGEEKATSVADVLHEIPRLIAEKMLEAEISAQLLSDYEEVSEDQKRLVRELDVALNGPAGAAKQASLCDILAQVRNTETRIATKYTIEPHLSGVTIMKMHDLYAKGLKPVGVIMMQEDGARATIDMGKVLWEPEPSHAEK